MMPALTKQLPEEKDYITQIYPVINVNRNPQINDAVAQLFSIIISTGNRSTFPALFFQVDMIYLYTSIFCT